MPRHQVTVCVDALLKEAVLFSAARDGLAPSAKIRQILTQQLARTIASADFQEHVTAQNVRACGKS